MFIYILIYTYIIYTYDLSVCLSIYLSIYQNMQVNPCACAVGKRRTHWPVRGRQTCEQRGGGVNPGPKDK